MYVEQYFFRKWWRDERTTEEQRQDLRKLVENGQWEFVMGSMVMPDEATTTYSADIDQLTEGHIFLNETFGIVPNGGWQIDPFGSSNSLAALYAMTGFKWHVINRINYQVKNQLTQDLGMEFLWKPMGDSTNFPSIFTHVLEYDYCQPMVATFDFESKNQILNPHVTDDNLALRATEYAIYLRYRSSFWATSHLLTLHQCDFAFQRASLQFDNMDKIINYIADHPQDFNMSIRWSTPSEYFHAISQEKRDWPTRGALDFFGYDDTSSSWWSGFYTSRPQLKGLVRKSEAHLRLTDLLYSSLSIAKNRLLTASNAVDQLREALAIAQHHDAVTGTSTQNVADDYSALLWNAMDKTTSYQEDLISLTAGSSNKIFTNSTLTTLRVLQPGKSLDTIVYNPLLVFQRKRILKLPAWSYNDLSVVDADGHPLRFTAWPNLDEDDLAISPATLYVEVLNIPPAGWTMITIKRAVTPRDDSETTSSSSSPSSGSQTGSSSTSISNNRISITTDPYTGLIDSIIDHKFGRNQTISITQDIMAYPSFSGPWPLQSSGAYIFRPAGEAETVRTGPITPVFRKSELVEELFQVFSPYASQAVRLFDGYDYMEVSHWIGPLPGGKEIITRWKTSLQTERGRFFTDDNGYTVNQRSWYDTDDVPIAANYFPTVFAAYLQEENGLSQFALVSDRSHGASSQQSGSIELMLHRRLDQDDKRGVVEPLAETTIINPVIHVITDRDEQQASSLRRKQVYELNNPLSTYFYTGESIYQGKRRWSPFTKLEEVEWPSVIYLVNSRLLSLKSRQLILRFINLSSPDDPYPFHFSFDITTLGKFCNIRQTSLNGMQTLSRSPVANLEPQQIVTFVVSLC